MTYKQFCEDLRTVYAVTRCFEIISELHGDCQSN